MELPLLDSHVYSDNVLPDDASSTDVQMPAREPGFIWICVKMEVGTYPTSELPMRPSLRPTAKPCAANWRQLCPAAIVSMFVVSAARIALPSISLEIPQPS